MKKFIFIILLIPFLSWAEIQVATTTTDIAALVKEVAQDKVSVFSIAKGTQDPHQIEAKPSFMVKLRSADLVIAQGLELESAWINPLIQGSRNPKLSTTQGYLELAGELDPIEVPKGNISRADGDVHPGGNPHFQLDPIRLGRAAALIAQRLSQIDPKQKDFFSKNADAFQKKMKDDAKNWQARVKKLRILEIVTYHKNFSYFCERFQIKCETQLEPKPGIPPTASHLLEVIDHMKKNNVKIVLIENLYDNSIESKLKQSLPKVFVARVPVMVDGADQVSTNEELIENLIQTLEKGSK